jgi:hypothetical protein
MTGNNPRPISLATLGVTLVPLLVALLPAPAFAQQRKPRAGSASTSATKAERPPVVANETHPAPEASGPATQAVAPVVAASTMTAQNNQAAPGSDAKPAEPPPEPKEKQPEAPANPPSFAEQLPGSAFLRPRVPGLWGGSLFLQPSAWATQWPYVPRTGIGFSGAVWVDTGYEKITRTASNEPNTAFQLQQGRAVLRATPTYSDGQFFVQGQAELVANNDQLVSQQSGAVVDTDDLWVRLGSWNKWDVQAGRYEAWELYHLGMGLDLNTLERRGAVATQAAGPPSLYGVSFAYYRPSGVGNVALHVYPSDLWRVELLGQIGNEVGLNTVGGRPSLVLDLGIVRIKGGGEYRVSTAGNSDLITTPVLDANMQPVMNPDGSPATTLTRPSSKQKKTERGYGGSVQLVLDPYIEMGVSAARGLVDDIPRTGGVNTEGSFTVTSLGGFANARIIDGMLLGVGADYTTLTDLHVDNAGNAGHSTHLQAFIALQYLVWKQLFVKVVAGYAKGHMDPSFDPTNVDIQYDNTMLSGRVRLMYLF